MHYWHTREITNRLISDRQDRKDRRTGQSDTQLAGGIGFQWVNDEPEYDD